MDDFDVIVIGGGPAGEHFVGHAVPAGLSCAVVESELLGGECSYWACMPSKALLRPGHVLAEVRDVPGAREAASGSIDVPAALTWRDEMVSNWDDTGQVAWLEGAGATLVRGRGRLAGERLVEVDGPDGSVRQLRGRRAVVVATGSSPAVPPIEGLAAARYWTSRDITSAESVPERLIVLGGGVVGAEMAQAWRRLGATEVTVVEAGPRLLANHEPFVGAELAAAFVDEGIAVATNTKVESVYRETDGSPVHVRAAGGAEFVGDELVVAVGRRPNTAGIGLEQFGLESGRYVEVDGTARATAVPAGWLYALGDANGRALLTHMGKYEARLAARAIAGELLAPDRPFVVTSVVFTDPEVGAVGMTVDQAEKAGRRVRVVSVPSSSVAGASVFGESVRGTRQLVCDADRQTVIGATFTGALAGELLHAATIAIVGEVPLERLRDAVPSFPTLSECWLELVESFFAHP